MKRIPFLILLLLTVAAVAARGNAVDARLPSGITIHYENAVTDRDGVAFIRELDRELTRLFGLPAGGRCAVVIRNGAERAAAFRRPDGTAVILLPLSFIEHRDDPAMIGSLAARLTLGRLNLADRGQELPPWLTAALTDVLKVNRRSARILRNVRYFPLLRVLVDLGHTPDFRAVMQVQDVTFTGAAAEAFGEISRFLLEYLAGVKNSRNAVSVGDYAAAILTGRTEAEAYGATLGNVMGSPEQKRHLQIAMLRAAYNFRTPRPAESILRRLPELLTVSYHTLDAGGEATGPLVKAPAAELVSLLAAGHPEAVAVQQQTVMALRDFAVGAPEELQPGMQRLIRLVERLTGRDPAGEKKALQKARLAVEKAARQRLALETRLLEAERERFPFSGLPTGWDGGDNGALSQAAWERLKEEEEKYLAPVSFRR